MNAETLISQAGYAIDMFKIDYNETCCLCIKDGFVAAMPARKASHRIPSCLFLTRIEQKRGLTNTQCSAIGKVLLKLYNEQDKHKAIAKMERSEESPIPAAH